MLISESYREQNRKLHQTNIGFGISGAKYRDFVKVVVEKTESTSVLDYGCGKQLLKKSLPEYNITGYDPCIEGLDLPPAPHDVVYCGDVLEHIEPDCLDAVLSDIHRLTIKMAILATTSKPAAKTLPDGRNAHLIQEPMWWWSQKISEKFHIVTYEYRKGDHIFLVRHLPTKAT